MKRRAFIAGLGSAVAWPVVARAQQSVRRPKIGVLWHAGNEQEEAIYLGALRQGLSEVGYTEGKNIELVNRFADEHYERFDALAKILSSLSFRPRSSRPKERPQAFLSFS